MQSIYEIAKGTNFSPATISRALNPALKHKVKPQTLEKILKYCKEHDYYGNLAARSLASGKTLCIGLVLASIIWKNLKKKKLRSDYFVPKYYHGGTL